VKQLKTETKTIGGMQVMTTQLPPLRALGLMSRLRKAGGAAGAEVSLAELLLSLPPDESKGLACESLVHTSVIVEGQKVDLTSESAIDSAFTGRLPALFEVVTFALETTFADFGDAAPASSSAPADAAAEKASASI
jgi:hypothetical protein